jgi:hypothetical protein
VKRKDNKQTNAMVYRNLVNVSGGISFNPNFIIANDVNQRNVISSTRSFEAKAVLGFIFVDIKISIKK